MSTKSKKSRREKRVEEDDGELLEETDSNERKQTDTTSISKKKKKKSKSKKSKRDIPENDFDDDEDSDYDDQDNQSGDTKSENKRYKKRTKRDKDKDEKGEENVDVFDNNMLQGDEDIVSGSKKNKKKKKKSKKGVSWEDEGNDDSDSDRDTKKNDDEFDDDEYDDERRNSSTRGNKKKKKKRFNNNDDDDWDDDDRGVMDDDDDWDPVDAYSSDDEYDDSRRRNRNNDPLRVSDAEVLVPGETPRDDSPEMRLLNRFRIALRQVGAHSDAKGFITALHNHFVGVGRSKTNQIEQGEFRDRLKEILRDTAISDYDVKRLMEILDSDGNGKIDWDEFVSFLSFPSKEMRKLVVSLRKAMIDEAGSSGRRDNFKTLFDNLLDKSDRKKGGITLPKLQGYIQRVLRKKLTPGEIAELFRQIDVNNDGKITQGSLSSFLKKNTHDLLAGGEFDDSYPIVDVAVSASKTDEANLRRLNFHKINENLNEGAIGRAKVFLWWRSASADDYDREQDFLKDRVTDVLVTSKNRDSMLTAEGFTCIDKSVSSGKLLPGGHAYIWIRKDPKDLAPVLNIAVTTGKARYPNNKIHFPPFYGFKLTEPQHNLNKTSWTGKDVFLWYRKKTFGIEKKRAKAGHVKHGSETALLAAIASQVKKTIRREFVDRDGQVDLEKAFQAFDSNHSGYISFRQFKRKLHKLGCHIEANEMSALHESVAGGSGGDHKISVKEFFDFVQHGANDIVAISKRLRRNLKTKSSMKGLQATFSEYDINGSGTVTKKQFQKVFKDIDIALTKEEMNAVWKRFDQDDSGVVDFNEFMVFVQTEVVSDKSGGEVEAGAPGSPSRSSRLKVNEKNTKAAMKIIQLKLKMLFRGKNSSSQKTGWLQVLKDIKKKHGMKDGPYNDSSMRSTPNRRNRSTRNNYDDDFASLNDDDMVNNEFHDDFHDDFNNNDEYDNNFSPSSPNTLSLPEMTAYIEKELDGRDIRDKMGDHEVLVLTKHFDSNNKNYITSRDLADGIRNEFRPPRSVRNTSNLENTNLNLLSSSGHYGSGTLSTATKLADKLHNIVDKIKKQSVDRNGRLSMSRGFKIFDLYNKRKITLNEFKDGLATLDESKNMATVDLKRIMSFFNGRFDSNGMRDDITFNEFSRAMRKPIRANDFNYLFTGNNDMMNNSMNGHRNDDPFYDDDFDDLDYGDDTTNFMSANVGTKDDFFDDFNFSDSFDDDMNYMNNSRFNRSSWDASTNRNNRNNGYNNGWSENMDDLDYSSNNSTNHRRQIIERWKRRRIKDKSELERRGVKVKDMQMAVFRAEKRRGRQSFDLHSIFRRSDHNQNGTIDRNIFARKIKQLGLPLTRNDFMTIINVFRVHSANRNFNNGVSASLDFDDNNYYGNTTQNKISYVRFLSVVSRRYGNAVISGQIEPNGVMSLSGDAVKERIRRVLRASKNQGMDLRKAFELFDKDGDGLVSARELQKSAHLLGVNLSDAEVRAMVKFLDQNGNNRGKIEYEELFQFASSGSTKLDIKLDDVEDQIRNVVHQLASAGDEKSFNMRKAFAAFDENGDGQIQRHEFRNALKKMKIPIKPAEFSALARRYDKTGSGVIDYEEFIARVKYTAADLDIIAEKLRKRVLEQTKRGISHWEQFQKLDVSGDGKISKKEFRNSMKNLDLNLSESETRALMKKFGSKEGGEILYKDFCRFLSPKNEDLSYLERRLRTRLRELARIRGGVRAIDLRSPFADLDLTSNGTISKREFEQALQRIGLRVESDELHVLCARFDSEGDGRINYREFSKFIDLDNKEMSTLCRQLYLRLLDVARDGMYCKDIFGAYDRYNETGVVSRMEFRDGCKKLGLPLTETEQEAVADRFALIGDSRRINYYEVLQWIASGANDMNTNMGWHGGNSPVRGNRDSYDIFGSTEASDDAVWNSKTVSGWLNKSASPRQRRRFNEVYSSLASFKERDRVGGRSFPRVPEVGGNSMMFRGGASNRLNTLYSSLPGSDPMMQSLPGGFGALDTRMLGNSMLGNSVLASSMGGPRSPMMSRFQLSTVDVDGEVEREFRDNRQIFQKNGKWACPVCFWASNTGFSHRCEMCNSANPYMAPGGGKSFSYGSKGQPGSSNSTSILGDTLNNRNDVTWRTDDRSDDEDDYTDRARSRSPRGNDRDSYGDRNNSDMGWKRRSSSYRRNLDSEFDRSSGSLSDSYHIPRSGKGSAQWSTHGSSKRRDSMHDRNPRSRSGFSRSSRSRSGLNRRGELGSGLSATWGGRSGR